MRRRGFWTFVKECQKLLHFQDMKDCKFRMGGQGGSASSASRITPRRVP